VVSEITERRRTEQRLAAQHAATRVLADSPSLEDAAPRLLEAVCQSLGWDVAALWLVDDETGALRCNELWHMPHVDIGRFATLSRRLALPRGVGLPGRVWNTRRPAWIVDVSLDPNFPRIAAASEIGLGSALAFPVVIGAEVHGVMEFFSRRRQQPDQNLLHAMSMVGGQIGEFIERKQAEQERIRLLAREHVARAEAEDTQQRFAFLAEVSAVLASSLDYETTLVRVARLSVPVLADWCAVDIAEETGLRRLAIAHVDPSKVRWADELERRYPPDPEGNLGPPRVVAIGEPEFVAEIPDELLAEVARDEDHLRLLREVGLRSYICVPLSARGRTLGALTFVAAESGRRYSDADLGLASEVASRAALAVDNARLYRQAQERAQAARVLTHVGDGVFLLDGEGVVRLWNPAAEAITGLASADVIGRRADEAIPRWRELVPRVPVAVAPAAAARAATVPLELRDRSLWLSISGVGFDEGTVYAFRDLTEERALEKMKTDFVSTISHELRTPLAAIYGAALTLRREDVPLSEDRRSALLEVIVNEADRLAGIVNDILWASRLDSGTLRFSIEECDPAPLVLAAIEAQRLHAPNGVDIVLSARGGTVLADPEKMRQVIGNLVENAVKYSPDGGRIEVALTPVDGRFRISVRDEGIGIPPSERERIFEKFYRLDPELTRGVGGTGLGLYICRELVERMNGRIWVEPAEHRGSAFVVELPAAGHGSASYGDEVSSAPAE
jgi:signal transduction histidine kinase